MKIESRFSPGDKAWTFDGDRVRERTVGQVHVIITESPGARGLDIQGDVLSYSGGGSEPENYAPISSRREEYMCVETGIGSGSIFTLGESIFATREECETAHTEVLARIAKDKADRLEWERKQLLSEEAYIRSKLAKIEAAKVGHD